MWLFLSMPYSPSQQVCAEGIGMISGLVWAKHNWHCMMVKPGDARVRPLIKQENWFWALTLPLTSWKNFGKPLGFSGLQFSNNLVIIIIITYKNGCNYYQVMYPHSKSCAWLRAFRTITHAILTTVLRVIRSPLYRCRNRGLKEGSQYLDLSQILFCYSLRNDLGVICTLFLFHL